MTKAELGEIISKVFALYYFFQAAWVLTTRLLSPLFHGGTHLIDPYILLSYTVSLLFFVAIALGFWFGAEKLGSLIAGQNPDKVITTAPAQHFMACVFVGFGCFLFSFIIPDLAELISLAFHDETVQKIKIQNINMAEKAVKIALYFVLSLLFILGANGLQRGVMLLRQIGQK